MRKTSLVTPILVLLSLWAGSLQAAQSEVIGELRSSLFQEVNAALKTANSVQSALLSPTNYSEGAEYYRRAEGVLESGGNIDTIRRDLKRATKAFRDAATQAELAATTFGSAIRAREDAVSANAEAYAAQEWRTAEVTFNDAAVRLERGRLERAQKEGVKAESQFRSAELIAIKANYLTETRDLLEKARDVKAPRYAPKSYNLASKLLAEASSTLENNRYDTDQPRNLAQAAKHNALHAIYVAELEEAIRSDDLTLEDILLEWEASIATLADLFDLAAHFDEGEEQAVSQIREKIVAVLSENKSLTATLEDRQIQLDTLIQETASMERLSKLVARQERQRERLGQVEALFTDNEALVLRQKDSIILRMVGLNFDFGKFDLKPEHEPLLGALERAINQFPESSIVIEGHTDAFGSDASNLTLSQKRADAVQQYLLTNTPVSPGNLTSLGYGESRPVSNNETEEGRKRNRRIDVVIYPKW